MNAAPLTLTFDPRTIEHLGVRMYSQAPNAVAELIANAYDADATRVEVFINADHSLRVVDDGHGMSREEINEKYLRIGRNRRTESASRSLLTESGRRRVSGKKGLGKLALFGIGRRIKVTTKRRGIESATRITMSYDELMRTEGDYHPHEESIQVPLGEHGTTVELKDLRRKTRINASQLASSLSRLFNYLDGDFHLTVVSPDNERFEIESGTYFEALNEEFSWRFPEDLSSDDDADAYLKEKGVSGLIVSTMKPLRKTPRGVTLYASGRMVNEPEFFGASESSHAYSYLSGRLDVDFIDSLEEDVIATDRRALVWDSPEMERLRKALADLLTRIGREWRKRRSEERRKKSRERTGISQEVWTGSIKSAESRKSLESLLEHLSDDDLDITAEQQARLTKQIHDLVPDHADYVWRHLHPQIQDASRAPYERGEFHSAIVEGIKRYELRTSELTGLSRSNARDLFNRAFGKEKKLSVFTKYLNVYPFTNDTANNIEEGQRELSAGLHQAFRNPISHEEVKALQSYGALTYEDCLDALSILSHLMRRVDDAVLRKGQNLP